MHRYPWVKACVMTVAAAPRFLRERAVCGLLTCFHPIINRAHFNACRCWFFCWPYFHHWFHPVHLFPILVLCVSLPFTASLWFYPSLRLLCTSWVSQATSSSSSEDYHCFQFSVHHGSRHLGLPEPATLTVWTPALLGLSLHPSPMGSLLAFSFFKGP